MNEKDTQDLSTTLESQKSRRKLNHSDSVREVLHNQVDEPVTNFYENERNKWGYAAACMASMAVSDTAEKVESGHLRVDSMEGSYRLSVPQAFKYVHEDSVKGSMSISPVGDPTFVKRYEWRHIDDEDHYLHAVIQVNSSKRLRVPRICLQHVIRFNAVEETGYVGWNMLP